MALAGLLCAVLLGGGAEAHAALSLTYSIDGSNPLSSVYYDPSQDGSLHGGNIAVTQLAGTDTALHAGTPYALPVTSGVLSFVTGGLTGQTSNSWQFGSGGSLTVTGAIAPLSLNGTLLTGSFASATVTQLPLYGQFKFDIVGASLTGSDQEKIFGYFGLPAQPADSAFTLSYIATGTANGGFTSANLTSGSLVQTPAPTPIPPAFLLFGSGAFGILGLRRRGQA